MFHEVQGEISARKNISGMKGEEQRNGYYSSGKMGKLNCDYFQIVTMTAVKRIKQEQSGL